MSKGNLLATTFIQTLEQWPKDRDSVSSREAVRVDISLQTILRFVEPYWLSDECILLGASLSILYSRRDVVLDPILVHLFFKKKIDDKEYFNQQVERWKHSVRTLLFLKDQFFF